MLMEYHICYEGGTVQGDHTEKEEVREFSDSQSNISIVFGSPTPSRKKYHPSGH